MTLGPLNYPVTSDDINAAHTRIGPHTLRRMGAARHVPKYSVAELRFKNLQITSAHMERNARYKLLTLSRKAQICASISRQSCKTRCQSCTALQCCRHHIFYAPARSFARTLSSGISKTKWGNWRCFSAAPEQTSRTSAYQLGVAGPFASSSVRCCGRGERFIPHGESDDCAHK